MKLFISATALVLLTSIANAQVQVDVVLNPMGDFKAKASDVKGHAVMKGDEVSAENIVVPLKGLKTGIELRDKHTLKYLEVDKYPEAILVSATGKGGKGKGIIKIRGVEKEVVGVYKVDGKKLKAKFKLKLSDFGINDVNYMGVGVEDEVTLQVLVPVQS